MKRKLPIWCIAFGMLLVFVGRASAGPLASDAAGISGWEGTKAFNGSIGPNKLAATVDYAVFAPGAFENSTLWGGDSSTALSYDPSGGTQYVYAYEIFNNATGGNVTIQNLSVSLFNGGALTSLSNITDAPITSEGGYNPDTDSFIVASGVAHNAKWVYSTVFPTQGQHSDILIFTSLDPPMFGNAAITGGHAVTASSTLPTPNPEPSTIVLGVIAAASLGAVRLFRRSRG